VKLAVIVSIALLAPLAVAQTTTPKPKPLVVGDALCVSQSDAPFLALAPDVQDAYLAALANAGWKLMRTDFTWSRIQPTPSGFDFSAYDDLVSRADTHGVKLLGILDYGVDWASKAAPAGDDRYPPDDPHTFATFASMTAKHFRGKVPAWEVWNEPNNGISGFWKPAPDPAAYAKLAMPAAKALRRADRKAKVVTGGLAPTVDVLTYGRDYGFFTAATAAKRNWWKRFTAAAIHPYTFLQAPPPETDNPPTGPSVAHQMRDFRDRLSESRASTLPVWVTELGWHTAPDSGVAGFPPGVSELDQARFLVRGVTIALSQAAERVCWYTLLDYANEQHDKEAAFGLFRYQATPVATALDPKPAYTAAATFGNLLGATHFVKDLRVDLNLTNEQNAFSFGRSNPNQTIIVFWSTTDGGPTVHEVVAPNVKDTRRIEIDGTQTDLGLPTAVDLTLGPTPFYIVFDEK
jgi:hypothetical protein